jgi:hypothetical protein
MGFNATRNDTGAKVITTAGHCDDVSASHSDSTVGAMVRQQYGNTLDGQFNSVEGWWSTSRWVILHDGAQAYQTSSVYTGTNLANATVCSSGFKSGPFDGKANCGSVTDPDWEGKNEDGIAFVNQFVFAPRVAKQKGDSGGPVFYSGEARGVQWGATSTRAWASYAKYLQDNLRIRITTS